MLTTDITTFHIKNHNWTQLLDVYLSDQGPTIMTFINFGGSK